MKRHRELRFTRGAKGEPSDHAYFASEAGHRNEIHAARGARHRVETEWSLGYQKQPHDKATETRAVSQNQRKLLLFTTFSGDFLCQAVHCTVLCALCCFLCICSAPISQCRMCARKFPISRPSCRLHSFWSAKFCLCIYVALRLFSVAFRDKFTLFSLLRFHSIGTRSCCIVHCYHVVRACVCSSSSCSESLP